MHNYYDVLTLFVRNMWTWCNILGDALHSIVWQISRNSVVGLHW